MRTSRSLAATVAATGFAAAVSVTLAAPAQAMPERFADVGTIVWCDGEGGFLTADDTTQSPSSFTAVLFDGDLEAFAFGDAAVLVGDRLLGTFPATDASSGAELGDLTIDGQVTRGVTETLSGWDIDPDGRRTRTEGTRTPLTGSVTLSLGDTSATLSCTGWDIDMEVFRLNRQPVADRSEGWLPDSYELEGGAGYIGFYGERETELGIALDLVDPAVFAGERLQVRNGQVEGTIALHDPETWEVTGTAMVRGTVTKTGTEHVVDGGDGYRYVTDVNHYDVALTITTATGEWSGRWQATHETNRSRSVLPPKAI
ncbi:hypothetical protein OO014_18015 [Intrasporangium calvum]|uniref:Htaa domain-containing protein n=1 Tax=Intrasporangium calvum TaxID=53358 RepID=A0ABT5GLN4_9MICO|nr:hypothetical protein [Intrasporangium calvum]MDC5699149.1 hypothetical protein [Intrasporangium calvum]